MSQIKSIKTNPDHSVVTIADVTRYLAFQQAVSSPSSLDNKVWADEVSRGCKHGSDLDISDNAKELGAAIESALPDIKNFGYRNTQKMVFAGSYHLTEERQALDSDFFYANKDNVLAIYDEIQKNHISGYSIDKSKETRDHFETIKQSSSFPAGAMIDFHSGVSAYGVIISQILYEILYFIELYHTHNFYYR